MAKPPGEISTPAERPSNGRLMVGSTILVIWPLSKLVGPIIVLASDYSTGTQAMLIGILFTVVPKLCFFTAIAVLGRAGFYWVKDKVIDFLEPIIPPYEVGRLRYKTGLVLFTVPLFVGWSFPYTSFVPAGIPQLVYILSWASDLMLIASLFVLGGAFLRKLQSLIIRTELADFSQVDRPASLQAGTGERRRLIVGIVLIVAGVLVLAGTPLIGVSNLSSAWKSQIYGWAALGPIVLFIAAAIVVRRTGASHLLALMTRTVPETVGKARYVVGLVMFVIPIVFGFSIPHLASAVPGYATNAIIFGLASNAVLLVSLFVLGGGFWGKLEALYVQDATVRSFAD
jgi:hypothetical protein